MPVPVGPSILRYFQYAHLPPDLQVVAREFHDIAWALTSVHRLEGPELSTALRKLLEAKDAAVRAALDKRIV